MLNSKKYLGVFVFIVVLVFFISYTSGITARIGSSRMILRLDVDEIVERSILVQNVNEIPVTIELTPLGELAKNVDLEVEEFVLLPDEEREVSFTIYSDKPGKTETKINVGFKPDEGGGVGLASTIIVIAGGSNEPFGDNDENDNTNENEEDENEIDDLVDDIKNVDDGGFSLHQGRVVSNLEEGNEISAIKLLSILTGVLVASLIVLFFYSLKTGKPKKKVTKKNA